MLVGRDRVMAHCIDNNAGTGKLPARIGLALDALLESFHFAEQTTRKCWDFAVDRRELNVLGLTPNDYRFLVLKGWVEHRCEVTVHGSGA